MPYGIERQEGQFCVFKLDADNKPAGDTLGCHATEDAAEAQRRALYASEEDKTAGIPTEYKTFDATFSEVVDEDRGIVEHYIAVMGNRDDGGDVIHPGAFRKTLVERGNRVRVVDQHRTDSILRVLGKPLELREVGREGLPAEMLNKYPDVTGALLAKTQYLLNTPEGAGAFQRIKSKAIDEYSIGYDAIPGSTDIGKDSSGNTVRNLREIRLWEYSPVLWGMNSATMTVGVKTIIAPDITVPVVDPLTERKEALVATLRAALAEAEAFVAAQAAPETEDTAPADEAGRVEHAAEEGAEPPPALTPEQEAQRLALLAEIQQLTEED